MCIIKFSFVFNRNMVASRKKYCAPKVEIKLYDLMEDMYCGVQKFDKVVLPRVIPRAEEAMPFQGDQRLRQ